MQLKYRLLTLILVLCALSGWGYAKSVEIVGARLSTQAHDARLVLELTQPNAYKVFLLNSPKRLVIDLPAVKLATDLKELDLAHSPFKAVRFAYQQNKQLRIVFDLYHHVNMKAFPLKPFGLYGDRLVIDLDHDSLTKPFVPKTAPTANKGRNVIVAIDAGHGGHDAGASGAFGLKEKDVVLKIAKKLKKQIDQQPGMKAVLTRDGDYFIALRERIRKARRYKADVFIAVHADAFRNPHSHGAAVYALSERGASSEAARWLAAKDNYSELGKVALKDKDQLLKSVLLDLSQTATIDASLRLGKSVLGQMGKFATLHHGDVEQAPFVVLKSPDIPSILIETGFISNRKEASLLRNSQYQLKLAKAIRIGLSEYFANNAPRGTILALKSGTHHG